MSCTHHQSVLRGWDVESDLPDATALHLDDCAACTAVFATVAEPVALPTPETPNLEALVPTSSLPFVAGVLGVAGLSGLAVTAALFLVVAPPASETTLKENPAEETPMTEAEQIELMVRIGYFQQEDPEARPLQGIDIAPPEKEYPLRRALLLEGSPPPLEVTWVLDQGAIEGRTVVLFWTSGCQFCDGALSKAQAWHVDGVHVLGVTNETDEDVVLAYLEDVVEGGVSFPNAIDSEGLAWEAWGITAWPAAVLVDDGVVVAAGHVNEIEAELGY